MFSPSQSSDWRESARESVARLTALKTLNDNIWAKPKSTVPNDRTQTKEESLSGSLLKYMDTKNASKADLEEAFCRDIDSFNEAFQV